MIFFIVIVVNFCIADDNHREKGGTAVMEKMKIKERVNWPVTILLLLGLITVAFPLYMTIVIALKKPSEMTNSISGSFLAKSFEI